MENFKKTLSEKENQDKKARHAKFNFTHYKSSKSDWDFFNHSFFKWN